MEEEKNTRGYGRYVALDIHKEYVLAGGQNPKQEWVLPPRRISMAKFREWAIANLQECAASHRTQRRSAGMHGGTGAKRLEFI